MRSAARSLVVLLAIALLAACGSSAEQDKTTIADALQAVSSSGARIDVQNTILDSGGTIPKGRAEQFKIHGVGTTRDGKTSMLVTFAAAAGRKNPSFDVVLTDSEIFAVRHGSTAGWQTQSIEVDNFLFVPARLPLLRETVLLASKESNGGLAKIDQGFARKYTITPAPDQLLQMLVNSFGGTEAAFLKTARGHLDFFIGTNGKLLRVETHLVGINPDDKAKMQIDAVTVFSHGSARPIETPIDSQPVAQGSPLFSSGP